MRNCSTRLYSAGPLGLGCGLHSIQPRRLAAICGHLRLKPSQIVSNRLKTEEIEPRRARRTRRNVKELIQNTIPIPYPSFSPCFRDSVVQIFRAIRVHLRSFAAQNVSKRLKTKRIRRGDERGDRKSGVGGRVPGSGFRGSGSGGRVPGVRGSGSGSLTFILHTLAFILFPKSLRLSVTSSLRAF